VEEKPPGWARGSAKLRDVLNQIVVASRGKTRYRDYAAFFVSDNTLRDRIADRIRKQEGALGKLSIIPAATMNAAFVRGQTITLWMSGTHRRVPTRVDNKVISGLDLRYALDPLEDQSFFFTAARSRLDDKTFLQPVGSSPRRSRVWMGPSQGWPDFTNAVTQVFDRLVGTVKPEPNPLPVLASPVADSTGLSRVAGAYDVALIPPELLEPTAANPEVVDARERLSAVVVEPFNQDGPDCSLRLYCPADTEIGTADIKFSITAAGDATWSIENEKDADVSTELFDEVVSTLRHRPSWLKVWYDSGHTLADERFFANRFRDQPFDNFVWERFKTGEYTISREKPTPLSRDTIGEQDSLFCWVKNRWTLPQSGRPASRGWLACDDGAMEKADFIHIDTIDGVPTLSLIHVKGAGSIKATRKLSVSDYEVVTSQAVKNLRWIDSITLEEGLSGRLQGRIQDKVWHNGKPSTAKKFLAAARDLGTNYSRNVVIVQPSARRSAVETARRAARDSVDHLRLLQLEALLLGARANILALNANMHVIAQAS
jgi:hypothetical protein